MRAYEKIETLYNRSLEGSKELVVGSWRDETVKMLKDIEWEWTEKIDGTNIRVFWDGHAVSFGGRTERALIPAPLVNRLNDLFGGETNAQLFEQMFGDKEVYLYGEGYGQKIQGVGSLYLPNSVDFILFDLMISGNYQPRAFVESTAKAFGTQAVPVVGSGTLEQAWEYASVLHPSTIGAAPMEGIVCRPKNELLDRCGRRIIVKLKYKDIVRAR